MFDFLKRSQLIKRGLASRKTRRRRPTNELLRSLEYAPSMQVADLCRVRRRASPFSIFSGQQPEPTKNFVIALLFFATALTQLWINQPTTFLRSSRLLLVFGVIFVQLAATKLSSSFATAAHYCFLRPETAA